MVVADESAYSEVASKISDYIKKIEECCGTLETAANDCVENTQGDPAAAKSSSDLKAAVGKIQEQMPVLQGIVSAMNQQIEKMQEASSSM